MNDGDEDRDDRTESADTREEDEKLDDLEPGDRDASALKGGGPKAQQSLPGGGPTD